jgi:hypothetical protein
MKKGNHSKRKRINSVYFGLHFLFQTNLYKHVIDDVVRNMKEEYLNESMDTELLEELKQVSGLWSQSR